MNFKSINVSGLGPFAENQTIRFNEGINVVKGPHGAGKTTIFRALEQKYREKFDRHNLPTDLAARLVFVGEDEDCDQCGKGIVEDSQLLPNAPCIHVLPTLISHHVNQMIAPKVMLIASKRSPFQAQISEFGEVQIVDTTGNSLAGFSAASERFLLSLACNLALRELFQFTDPIVVDDAFGMLDNPIMLGCHKEIERSANQGIYLLSETCGDRIPVTAGNVLQRTDSGHTCVAPVCA